MVKVIYLKRNSDDSDLVFLGLDNLAQAANKNEYYYEMRRDVISLLS